MKQYLIAGVALSLLAAAPLSAKEDDAKKLLKGFLGGQEQTEAKKEGKGKNCSAQKELLRKVKVDLEKFKKKLKELRKEVGNTLENLED